jgi:hypothetical protein
VGNIEQIQHSKSGWLMKGSIEQFVTQETLQELKRADFPSAFTNKGSKVIPYT